MAINLSKTNNNSVDNSIIPADFLPLQKFCRIKFNEGKISLQIIKRKLFNSYTTEYTFFNICLSLMILNKKEFSQNTLIIISTIFLVIILYLFIKECFPNTRKIIDLKNQAIYSEIKLFFIPIRYAYINLSKIISISNNIVPTAKTYRSNKYGERLSINHERIKPHEYTNQFHNCFVSFLLNNGKIINFIEVGMYLECYEESKEIAKILSNYLNIPLFTCNEASKLSSVYNEYKDTFELMNDNIEPLSPLEAGLTVVPYLFVPLIVGFALEQLVPLSLNICMLISYKMYLKL